MVAKKFPSPIKPPTPFDKLKRLKDNYGNDISEQARVKRGPFMPGSKPTPPVRVPNTKTSSNGVTPAGPPAAAKKKTYIPNPNNDPGIFLKNHPILAGLNSRAKQGKFLDNHPRIANRANEVAGGGVTSNMQRSISPAQDAKARQAAVLRRLKRVSR